MIKDFEIKMWEAAKANNSENFLNLLTKTQLWFAAVTVVPAENMPK